MNAERIRQCQKHTNFHIQASKLSEIYGCDVKEIKGRQHLVVVDYKTVSIFEHQLNNLQCSTVIDALKSIFCDVRSPDKLISDNVRYFVSDEFKEFIAKQNTFHVTTSPRYPQGNSPIDTEC